MANTLPAALRLHDGRRCIFDGGALVRDGSEKVYEPVPVFCQRLAVWTADMKIPDSAVRVEAAKVCASW